MSELKVWVKTHVSPKAPQHEAEGYWRELVGAYYDTKKDDLILHPDTIKKNDSHPVDRGTDLPMIPQEIPNIHQALDILPTGKDIGRLGMLVSQLLSEECAKSVLYLSLFENLGKLALASDSIRRQLTLIRDHKLSQKASGASG